MYILVISVDVLKMDRLSDYLSENGAVEIAADGDSLENSLADYNPQYLHVLHHVLLYQSLVPLELVR